MVVAVMANNDVVSFLQQAGKRYEEHKELLRQRQLEAERRKCSFRPAVTEYAENVSRRSTSRRSVAVEKRLHELHAKRLQAAEARRAESRERREAELAAEVRGPWVTEQARALMQRDPVNVSREWLERREKKLSQLREEALRRELAAVRDVPCITQYARENAIDRRRQGQSIEDYLMAKEEARRRRMYWLTEHSVGRDSSFCSSSFSRAGNVLGSEQNEEQYPLFAPRITKYAKRLCRPGTVVDRLFAEGTKGKEKVCNDACTFAPHVDPVSLNMSKGFYRDPNATVYERLYHNDTWKMRELRKKKAFGVSEAELIGIPCINKTSRLIVERKRAEEVEKVLQQSATNRLCTKTGVITRNSQETSCHLNEKTKRKQEEKEQEACTFRPQINAVSDKMWKRQLKMLQEDGYAESAAGARELLWRRSQRRIEEENRQRREMEAKKEMAECTFHPRVGRPPERHVDNFLTVSERNRRWQLQRERRLVHAKQELERTQLSECSFRPSIDPLFPLPVQDASTVAGYEAHIMRQEESRRRKREAQDWWRPRLLAGDSRSRRGTTGSVFSMQQQTNKGLSSRSSMKSNDSLTSHEDYTEFVVCQAPSVAVNVAPRSLSSHSWREQTYQQETKEEKKQNHNGAMMRGAKPSPVDFIINHHRAIVDSARCY